MTRATLLGLIAVLGVLAVIFVLATPRSESGSSTVGQPSAADSPTSAAPGEGPGTTSAPVAPSTSLRDIPVTDIVPPPGVYDPVQAGETLPDDYRALLPRDAIRPVYNPSFRSVAETDWPADALVIGVVIEDDARAYPVSFLNRREIVVDRIAGSPVLVTW